MLFYLLSLNKIFGKKKGGGLGGLSMRFKILNTDPFFK